MELYKKILLNWAKKTAKEYDLEYASVINGEKFGNALSAVGITLELKDSYFNAKEILKNYPTNYALIVKAYEMAGVKMRAESGRGGSDACDITYMGIPTYNMFAGSHNEHSQDEWVSSKQMLASYNVALNYIKLMAKQNRKTLLNESKAETTPDINISDEILNKINKKIATQYGNSFSNF